jgi:hypothetical protein
MLKELDNLTLKKLFAIIGVGIGSITLLYELICFKTYWHPSYFFYSYTLQTQMGIKQSF